MSPIHPVLRYVIAAFYGYGAEVHVANIAGLSGFDWPEAPVKWQVLDVACLALDLVVVLGLLIRVRVGIAAFLVAAASQVLLYTVLRDWILDVPAAFTPAAEQAAHLDTLVAFHIVTLALVAASLIAGRRGRAAGT